MMFGPGVLDIVVYLVIWNSGKVSPSRVGGSKVASHYPSLSRLENRHPDFIFVHVSVYVYSIYV